MYLILLDRDCADRREGCTIAGGVMESGIAEIAMFLQATLDRAATVICLYKLHKTQAAS
jgi:hypothetical protein